MTKPRMRVLVLAPHFAEYTLRLATSLAARAEVMLVIDGKNLAQECEDVLVREARRAGVRTVTYRYSSTLARAFWLFAILAHAWLFRPEVIHVQEQADKSTARLVGALARLAPMVLTVHDPEPHSGIDAERARLTAGYRAAMRGLAKSFHVHGAFCARLMRSTLHPEDGRQIVPTAHGVILTPSLERLLASTPQRILFFGRMETYKGVEILLDAFDLLVARGVPVQLAVAGRGPEADRLGERMRGTEGVELYASFLTPSEAIEQFQRASAVITPYLDATQSGVVAAAIANGRPLVASRVGGLIDAVGDGAEGLLVEPGDARALAAAIACIITDRTLQTRLAGNALAAAGTKFSWNEIGATMMEVYEALRAKATKA